MFEQTRSYDPSHESSKKRKHRDAIISLDLMGDAWQL